MGGIFISYRRDDATGYVHALHERLAARFGRQQIFMDIDSIEPGLDFVEVLESSVAGCDVLLALIGKRWLETQRLDDSHDFVRLEIQAALERKIRVIPVLLEGTEMPKVQELPEALAALSRRQAFEISNRHFSDDLNQLADLLGKILADQEAKRAAEAPPQTPPKVPAPAPTSRPAKPPILPRPKAKLVLLSLGGVAMATLSFLAWLFVIGEVAIGIRASLDVYKSIYDTATRLFFFVTTDLLLLSAGIMAIRKSLQTWKILFGASLWQIVAYMTLQGLSLSSGGRADGNTMAIFAVPFLFLAYRHRPKAIKP